MATIKAPAYYRTSVDEVERPAFVESHPVERRRVAAR